MKLTRTSLTRQTTLGSRFSFGISPSSRSLNLPRPVRDQTLPSSLAHGAKMYATLMSERVYSGIPTGFDPIVVLAGRHMGQGTASMDSH